MHIGLKLKKEILGNLHQLHEDGLRWKELQNVQYASKISFLKDQPHNYLHFS